MILPPELPQSVFEERFEICRLDVERKCVYHPELQLPKNFNAIYLLRHPTTGGYYFGSATELGRRLKEHRSAMFKGNHRNKKLQECYDVCLFFQASYFLTSSREEAFCLEQKLIALNKNDPQMLNISFDVSSAMYGRHHSEETKAKIGNANRGRKQTQEVRDKVSAANKGRVFTAEQRQRMSLSKMGKVQSEETKQKRRLMMLGNKIGLGRKHTDETKEAIRLANINKTFSEETRRKMREARAANPRIDPRSVPVQINGVRYTSASAAAKVLGIGASTADFRCKSKNYADWFIIKE